MCSHNVTSIEIFCKQLQRIKNQWHCCRRDSHGTCATAVTLTGAVGSNVDHINEVTLRRARLVLGWVAVRAGNLSQSNQPPRSTQPGHPYVGRRNEYRSKGGDALRLGVKADMVMFAGNTV